MWKTKPRWQDREFGWISDATDRADHLLQEHPWSSAGTIFAVGLAVGCAIGLGIMMSIDRPRPPQEAPRRRAAGQRSGRAGART